MNNTTFVYAEFYNLPLFKYKKDIYNTNTYNSKHEYQYELYVPKNMLHENYVIGDIITIDNNEYEYIGEATNEDSIIIFCHKIE